MSLDLPFERWGIDERFESELSEGHDLGADDDFVVFPKASVVGAD